MRPGNYPTNIDKLKDIKETQKCDEALIKHYTWIKFDFETIIRGYDNDIAVIQAEKDAVIKEHIEAPARILQYTKHLEEMKLKYKNLKDAAGNVEQRKKRLTWLKERAAVLQQELEDEGIDTNNVEPEGRTFVE